MNQSHTSNTVRLIVLVIISAVLASGSFWLVEVMRRQTENSLHGKPRNTIDYYVEKFDFVRLGPTGDARYNLSGDRLTHNPQDNSYYVLQPVMHSFGQNRPPMVSRSDYAIVRNNNTEVHMHDHARINRPAYADKQAFQLQSSYLLLLPDEHIIKTPKPVELTLGLSTLTGVGMVANDATGEFKLSSNVKGRYQMSPPRSR
jgi:lipopolysaccharide export system protein LptC